MAFWIPFCVALGGAIGSLCRFAAVQATGLFLKHPFPLATLIVNGVGSLLIGIWLGYMLRPTAGGLSVPPSENLQMWDAALRVGLLGGLTTFSSFSMETVVLLNAQQYGFAIANVLTNVTIGLVAAGFGLKLVDFLVA